MQHKKVIKTVLYGMVILFFVSVITDFVDVKRNEVYARNPEKSFDTYEDKIYLELLNNKEPDWHTLYPTLKFIKNEYDVADFKLLNLIRILYEFNDKIPNEVKTKIDKTLLNFRYWMDEPGENSMCYWSENHQILFSSAEFLIGKLYYNKQFGNSGLRGKERVLKARQRVLDWLEMRWLHGFTEFYSGTYYIEDIAALLNLIDYSNDEEIVEKSTIILDLIFYDVSTQIINGYFTTVSGRAYKNNRTGLDNQLGGSISLFKGNIEVRHGLLNGLLNTKYQLPGVLKEIAADTAKVSIKQKHGLSLEELKTSIYNGRDEKSIMMQWGMEAFVNPETIRNTMYTVRKNRMFSNDFLKELKMLDFTIVRWLHLEPLIVKMTNLPQQGKAIQEANTYIYKTKDYSLYSVQNYFPGSYADQHHIAGMNIGNHFSVFHTHPAREKNVDAHSPNYWVGYGRLPQVAQERNVSLSVYKIPEKKNIMEKEILHYTYTYFPKQKFDSIYLFENFAFGKKGNTYCGLIAKNKLSYRDNAEEELIQPGVNSFWIIEAGSMEDDGSFEEFYKRVMSNKVSFSENDNRLMYTSKNKRYSLFYTGQFTIDNKVIDRNYQRFNDAYSAFNKDQLIIQHNKKSLKIDFYKMLREEY